MTEKVDERSLRQHLCNLLTAMHLVVGRLLTPTQPPWTGSCRYGIILVPWQSIAGRRERSACSDYPIIG
jgi:hypothetical protein